MSCEEWNQRCATAEFLRTVDANRGLRVGVENLPPGRALDLATGERRNARWLAERGWEVLAVDFAAAGTRTVSTEDGPRAAIDCVVRGSRL